MTVDILAIGAHPDDIELGIGGLLHKLATMGHSTAILDLTRGESSTRGTVEERARESAAAAEILRLAARENAGLPDGQLANTTEMRLAIIPFLRRFRPSLLLAPMAPDRHPDHTAAHHLAQDANFLAGLRSIDTGQEPHRAPRLYFYYPYQDETPDLIVDISDHFEAKLDAIKAHASQFYNPDYSGPETMIASKKFWDSIAIRAAYWGNRAGFTYGENLYAKGPIPASLPPGTEIQ
jgi:N-acetylglucosamine malate deacetylase 1